MECSSTKDTLLSPKDPRFAYSEGFCDAFITGGNKASSVERLRGKRYGRAYSEGYDRGKKVAREYYQTTGNDPSVLLSLWYEGKL